MTKPYILVFADYFPESNEIYDPVADRWHDVRSINNFKSSFGISTLNNRVYVIGGLNNRSTFTKFGVECYDPETNVLNSVAPLNCHRHGCASCSLNGRIYALGGDGNVENENGQLFMFLIIS